MSRFVIVILIYHRHKPIEYVVLYSRRIIHNHCFENLKSVFP
jgi:hypothetical protein